ncbi:chromosome-associated kinesin KIF4A-like [Drosophila novamexicana]|uniref:chromosome-associated kinesin KIF4A-like n=1 Tax=Drosophila novamexicana TaxID=47314 RepID=UPI0011E58A94|nr:chromosome-associated kinesin KIF4A-like [Drosophila novamexicana]XP_030568914.1 chromosome-associated kinesin KIF4A-like [Drosophila novamexicana]
MSDSVAVALRVRPLVKSEVERGCRIAVQRPVDGIPQVTVNGSDSFTYNYVFDSSDSQQNVYKTCVRSKLKKLLHGYNVTILAYGQTGSGKTYTMGTAFDGVMDDNVGVIPRAVHEIFEETAALEEEFHFKITCSFVELYQEQFYDLFSPNKREDSTVDIREDKNRIVLPGLTEVEVKHAKHVTDQLMRGSSGRAVAATAMNETSSRSHAIFTLTVVTTRKTGQKTVTTSKFSLVDLAGSERCSKTLACGDRFKEGVNINKGLLALGNVINVLGSGQTAGYVPYRQSKLTRLLQDSLGGNSITLMIACVSPADYNVAETLSTLRYADRALQIKNKPIVNVDAHAAEVMMLKDIIQNLRVKLLACGGGGGGDGNSNSLGIDGPCMNSSSGLKEQRLNEQLEQLQQANARIEKKNQRLQQELHQALIDLAENEMRAHIAEVTHDKLKAHVLELKSKLTETAMPKAEEQGVQHEPDQSQQLLDTRWQEQMREITQLVTCVDEELQQTETALQAHRKECLNGGNSNGSSSEDSNFGSEEAHELMQSRAEEHTMKQLNLNGELRNINRQLDIKQELHDRVTRNFSKLQDDGIDEKFKQCEQKIEQLESERRELMDQLRTTKQKDTSAKLAEERRKRLQVLEQEIVDMRRKIVQQANMLKMREKEREKIQNLSTEIRAMKESKVKLIRAMRGESERFRQWKMMSEKQLTQLKSKDRKMQSEMARQQTLHAKQRLVLKRKCEEALATNRRLKDALERQRAAQAQRQRHAKDQPGAAKLDALVDRELEVILSLIDAEHSLEQLMEDRAIINAHCSEIRAQQQQEPQPDAEQAQLLASLEEELEMRNAQIADLQQKVCSNDLDSRMAALCDSVQSIGESRAINKQLLKSLVQQRREQAQGIMEQKVLVDEQRSQLNEAQQRHEELTKRLRQAEREHEQLMASQQRSYEEKVAVLLRSSHALGGAESQKPEDLERQKIVEELLSTKEALQQELDRIKSKQKATKKPQPAEEQVIFLNDSVLSDGHEDSDSDPDWVPLTKRSKKSHSDTATLEAASEGDNPNGSTSINNNTTANNSLQGSIDMSSITDETRKGAKCCKCRKNCNTKRCGCFSTSSGCSSSCKCRGNCQNPVNNADKENSTPSTAQNMTVTVSSDVTEVEQDSDADVIKSTGHTNPGPLSSPNSVLEKRNSRLTRNSELLLHTPSTKQKFF